MKKQILIFVFLVIAVFANVTMSYGQNAVHGSTGPDGTPCTSDALHPIAGVPYNYQVATNPSGGTYTWWATKNPVFITSTVATPTVITMNNSGANVLTVLAGDLLSATTNYNTALGTDQVGIIWSSNILANTKFKTNPTFVAVHYTPPAGLGCADNFKVFELDPKNAFTVDILNWNSTNTAALAYGATASQCVADVTSAKYNAGAYQMDYLYGYNMLYYEVIAANFTNNWMPKFQFTGLTGNLDQSAIAEWSYTNTFPAATTYPIDITTGATVSATTNLADTSNGVSIYVRITIQNNHFETLGDQTVTVKVDGLNTAGEWDVVNATCTPPAAPDFVDIAQQVIQKRPTVIEGTTSIIPTNVGIIPKNP